MYTVRPKTGLSRTMTCVAILAVFAVPETYAQVDERQAGSPTFVGSAASEDTVGAAKRHPVNPREWPLMAAAEHSARLSVSQFESRSAGRMRSQRYGRAYRQAQRITAAVALGILGSLVGGVAGAGIGAFSSEEAALPGFGIGMYVGGAAGATLGVLLVK